MFVDFNNKQNLIDRLNTLTVDQQPEWEIMTPQNMVEHLIIKTKIASEPFSGI